MPAIYDGDIVAPLFTRKRVDVTSRHPYVLQALHNHDIIESVFESVVNNATYTGPPPTLLTKSKRPCGFWDYGELLSWCRWAL